MTTRGVTTERVGFYRMDSLHSDSPERNHSSKIHTNCGVYAFTHIASGNQYVGSSRRLKRRYIDHLWALRRGKHHSPYFQRAWDAYGEEAFQYSLLEEVLDVTSLAEREQYYIDTLRPVYNMQGLAGSLHSHSEETKRRISAAHKGRKHGPTHSEESKRKIGAASKGHPYYPMSEAGRAKKVAARKQQPSPIMTPEGRARLSAFQKAHPHPSPSQETRAKLSASSKGRKASPETRARISAARSGRKTGPQSEETKKKRSIALKGRKFSDAHREKINTSLRLRKNLKP